MVLVIRLREMTNITPYSKEKESECQVMTTEDRSSSDDSKEDAANRLQQTVIDTYPFHLALYALKE